MSEKGEPRDLRARPELAPLCGAAAAAPRLAPRPAAAPRPPAIAALEAGPPRADPRTALPDVEGCSASDLSRSKTIFALEIFIFWVEVEASGFEPEEDG